MDLLGGIKEVTPGVVIISTIKPYIKFKLTNPQTTLKSVGGDIHYYEGNVDKGLLLGIAYESSSGYFSGPKRRTSLNTVLNNDDTVTITLISENKSGGIYPTNGKIIFQIGKEGNSKSKAGTAKITSTKVGTAKITNTKLYNNKSNRNNTRNKKTLNSVMGLKANGKISKSENTTTATRIATFEQNFLTRIEGMVDNSIMNVRKKAIPLDLKNYRERLLRTTNESEAILVYNELIALLIMANIYTMKSYFRSIMAEQEYTYKAAEAVGKGTRWLGEKLKLLKVKEAEPEKPHKDIEGEDEHDFEGIKKYIEEKRGSKLKMTDLELKQITSRRIIEVATVASTIGTLGMLGPGQIEAALNVGAWVINFVVIDLVFLSKGVSTVGKKMTIEDLARALLQIMFSPENVIQIREVKDKLNYWGLTQPQVNYMFSKCSGSAKPICYSQSFPMKSYLKRHMLLGKEGKVAPSGFDEKVLDIAVNLSIGDSTYETLAKNSKSNPLKKSAEELRANNIKRENASNSASIIRLTARRNALTNKTEKGQMQARINATRKRIAKRAADLAIIAISKTKEKTEFEKNLEIILKNEDNSKKLITTQRLSRAFDARVMPQNLPKPSPLTRASEKVRELADDLLDYANPALLNQFENLAKAVDNASLSIVSKPTNPPQQVKGGRKTFKKSRRHNKRRTY
jgi:hypothetical protein